MTPPDSPLQDAAVDLPNAFPRYVRQTGLRHVLHSGLTSYQRLQALRLSLIPIDFWRYAEFTHVLRHLPVGDGPILDIASPKVLGHYLSRRGARVISCDVHPRQCEEMAVYRRDGDRFDGLRASATELPIESGVIPFLYSVSVIEHIGGEGDGEAMKEIARVLASGGVAAITVPIASAYEEVWHTSDTFGAQPRDDGRVFFCRIYDRPSIKSRLCACGDLELVDARTVFSRDDGWIARYQAGTSQPRALGAIARKMFDGHWARRYLRMCRFEDAWPESRGVALLTFRKR